MIILNRVCAGFIGTDIDPQNCGSLVDRSQIPGGIFHAISIEPIAVDHTPIHGQTKHPRPRVARLRQRRNSADFNMAKPKAHGPGKTFGVLVKPCRQPQRIVKADASNRHWH